jgi:SAM-dependent methyltransferase
MPEIEEFDREDLGLPGGFVFLFVFDYHSVFERKNPLGLVEAFEQAFPEDSGASLVLKSINSEQHAEEHERLLQAAEGHPDIYVIDRYVTAAEKNAMFASCDCYVSLHRSEGFGNTLAEAMYLGKPVIATGYSGNMDFMTPQNSYPVDYDLRPVGDDAGPYPPTGEWAEPDIGHASALMRHVFEHREEAEKRGSRAADDLRRNHSPGVAGRAMAERLRRVRTRLTTGMESEPQQVQHPAGVDVNPTVHRIATTPRPVSPGSLLSRALSPARRVLLKLMWPFAMQQREVNQNLLAAIREVDQSVRVAINQLAARSAKNYTELLHAVGRQDARLEELSTRIEKQDTRFGRLPNGNQAIPYMAGTPFKLFEDPASGRVQGYVHRDGNAHNGGTYDAFEDIFRGPEDFIRDRQRSYLDLLGNREPVLDIGCGRGEFLDLLREQRLEYAGIDLDSDMVERCRAKGHKNVEVADANSYLEECSDDSIGVIFCAQVIEHLPYKELLRLFDLARRKLKAGGLFIAETINPHSPEALKTFWVDLTHKHPIFPEVALALCRINGFESAYVFHPNGTGDVEADRYETGEYAVVATRAARE